MEIMEQKDLAEKNHWDNVYLQSYTEVNSNWMPASYDALCLEHMLLKEIDRLRPQTVLEIGCGNSIWLPYLAKQRNVKVYGMDYSEKGCELAWERLKLEKVDGTIFCRDLFKADPGEIGRHDFVYSLGLVEHFSDLEDVLSHLLKFVRVGGALLTEVPNMASIHGIMSWIYQPEQLAKHKMITRKKLENAYTNLGLREIHSEYVGIFSLNIVAWSFNQRFPAADRFVLPIVGKMIWITDEIMRHIKTFKGVSPFSPFLYAIGTKSI